MKLENLKCIENIDIDKYIEFREKVKENMEYKEWLGDFSKEDIINLLKNNSKIWIYYKDEEPVCSMMLIPSDEESTKKLELNYNYKEIVDYGPMFVNKKYVGNGLQYQMLKELDKYAVEKGYKYAASTIHPDNVYSINNLEKDNFKYQRTKEFKRGVRNIYLKTFETKIIYYVHGTTYDNELKKCSGWKQVELNETGKNQAINLGKNTPYKFDILFTSDLIRAKKTATLAFTNIKSIEDKRLRECNYGDLDGEDKKLVIYEDHIEKEFPNGESLIDVQKRIEDFLKYIKETYQGKTIGIIAHRAPQLALDVITKKISWDEAIKNDWRKQGNWQPGWEYIIK